VVKFLRDKKTKQPKPLKSIFEKLVLLLELLTLGDHSFLYRIMRCMQERAPNIPEFDDWRQF
jgi:hypothetical protein